MSTSSPAPSTPSTISADAFHGSPLAWFDGDPRPGQRALLAELGDVAREADVLVIRAPVGAGKSRIAHALARWAGGGTILTPTNALVAQYRDTWPDLTSIDKAEGQARAAFDAQRAALRAAPLRVLNYYSYLAHRAYSRTVLVDEAHRLVPTLQNMEAVTLWRHLLPWPDWVRTSTDLLAWARTEADTHPRIAKLAQKLSQHPDTYTLEVGVGTYRGHERECLRLLPLTPRHNRPILWPGHSVRKLVFLSATFHPEDLYDLGLEGRRVRVVEMASEIPADRRPVIYTPVGSMGQAHVDATLPKLEAKLAALLARHASERGVILVTYALAERLRSGPLGRDPRLVWHTSANAGATLRKWLAGAGRDAKVLVACGMTEGLDLYGDRARWQAVCKLLYPDRGDTAVDAKARARPLWYSWVAARDLQQAAGRVCRGPEDYGVTYVLTSEFAGLWSKHRDLLTPSFREAVRFGD
jgi:Rad3-related DNA helicase